MTVKVVVKNGVTTMEVDDHKGPGCKGIVDAVVAASGAKITKEDPKDEFYASNSADATQSEAQ